MVLPRTPPTEEPRLIGADLDRALAVGHDLLRGIKGAFPVGVIAEPLRGGDYLIRIAWQTQSCSGGRSSRKRYHNHSREFVPPHGSRGERGKP